MKKALQVASVASMIDQFNRDNINTMKELGYEVHVAANFEFGSTCSQERIEQLRKELYKGEVNVYNLPFDRKIFNKLNIMVYQKLKKIIDENNYNIIHCHSPIGGVITRLAARKARKKGVKVIYTAHGFHFFKGAPILNWLIYFPVEFICSFFTDVLITINQEDYRLAQKVMKAKQIEYVPGVGIDVKKFKNIQIDKKVKRKELGVPEDAILLLSVGELNKNKNHEIIIEALGGLNNSNVHYCIAGQGELEDYLKNKIWLLGLQNQVHLLGYRKDVGELYHTADIFCFPSYREGLSVSLMEAMACGLPVICSNIRGNVDLISQSRGYLCAPNSVDEFREVISKLITLDEKKVQFSKKNVRFIREFSLQNIQKKMNSIYSSLI